MLKLKKQSGFTLIEMVVSIGIMVLVMLGIFGAFQYTYKIIYRGKIQILSTQLANEQLEIIRNLPYESVGILNGIPSGVLTYEQTKVRNSVTFKLTTTVRNIDDPFDGTIGGTPNDLSPADSKQAEVTVSCTSCSMQTTSVILNTRVAPDGLESSTGGGALFISVFDSAGSAVAQANVHIEKDENKDGVAELTIDDVTGNNGELRLIDMPPAVEAYKIIATKSGYSTDNTITASQSNPNPLKPPATVAASTVTNISFAIDKISSFNLKTQNVFCSAIGNVAVEAHGSKIIGANPDVYKYSQTVSTNGDGQKTLSNMEWDTYSFALPSASSYDISGSIPTLPVALAPNSQQDLTFILKTHTTNSLLATIKDSATKLPLSNAKITITKNSFIDDLTTGHGYLRQTDWSGSSGQAQFIDETKFWEQDGNVEIDNPAGDLFLSKFAGKYYLTGLLESSTFDTGTASNFTNLIWEPLAQPPACGAAPVKFQIATAAVASPETWNYKGPDGTSATYYTASDANISSVHNGDRYLRYKLFLNTDSNNCTPQVSDVAVSFTSGCTPPGQAFFSGLDSGTYTATVELSGYQTINTEIVVSGRTQAEILMSP
ncbi:MAG: prepilin-type N-terminal cleavage/methylation domain-containing protein [Candidatus Magasanikbacteria bacterium]|nr:prepilin-type N-terminal cleavage/methylation domain-containing protein [Candidatus Magasanikbacteria bacterium]